MMPRLKFRRSFETESFDMTPIIDVVFLLIIFFMLVCQFIAAEQFTVSVPDDIATAKEQESKHKQPLTITLMSTDKDTFTCAVGSEKLAAVAPKDLEELIQNSIDNALLKTPDKTVRLRCDRAVPFGKVKYILSGISQSRAENLDWTVLAE